MRLLPLLLVFLLAAKARAEVGPAAVATASKARVSVGEPFTVEVRATGPAGSTFAFPAGAATDSFELRPAAPSAADTAGVRHYQAAVFALGQARVPAIPIRYRLASGDSGAVWTAPIALEVVSMLPRSQSEQKLADIRPPVALPVSRVFWIGLALAILLVAALVWRLLARRRVVALAPEAPPAPALEPDEEARRALDQLVASGRLARGEYRPFYIDLTQIAKRYLERRLGAPIAEMTTAEMLSWLRSAPEVIELAPTLRDLAGAADQIKFARGRGLTEEAERHLAAVRGMVASVEARPRSAEPEGGQAA